MALSSSGTSARRWEYQVFLSFRGTDTRMGFVSHLYDKLHNLRGIRTFKDDHDLERGTTISPELLRAIEQSHFAIIVLSANYASSSWCLDELTKIVQSMEAGKILPVFYNVEPTIVRNQTESFAQAFTKHQLKFSPEKVKEWSAALNTVANISGWHVNRNKPESDLIDEVVNHVWEQVRHTFKLCNSPDKFVGRDFALHQVMGLLALGENDVRFIGITGMGGIGKTTLARIVFDNVSHDYDVRCFLANVREVSERECTLVGLQKKLLSPILKENVVGVCDEDDGANIIKTCLWNKKVLLVLDDVDLSNQLQKLAGGKDWFGNGSRIIITTRNHRLLVERDISLSYEVEEMSDDEALELFSLNAFKKDQPDEEFLELSEHVVKYAKGLPLVLKVWGSVLYKRDPVEWKSELDNLQNKPRPEVFDLLEISYDKLPEKEKSIFLDIACFHKGKCKQQVIDILNRMFDDNSSLSMINTLIERSLLTMSKNKRLEMHDLIQEMGWRIVDRESKEEPGNRTRIWRLDDLRLVLATNTGTKLIQAIGVNSPKLEEIRCDSNGFSNMRRLRHLELHNVKIVCSAPICLHHFLRIIHWKLYPWAPICLPPSLRIISWNFFPFEFLPQSFLMRGLTEQSFMHNLTELSMSHSKLVRLWDGRMELHNLKIVDLSGSEKLINTPNFTGMPKLERLLFRECQNLVDIHSSIAVLKILKVLIFRGCQSIKSLPSKLEMDSLEELDLSYCSKLKKVPEFSKQMKTLSDLCLKKSAIEQLPSSIGNLVGLTELDLSESAIEQLPTSIGNLVGLTKLDLSWTAIKQLPSSIGNLVGLTKLDLAWTAIEQLPSSIGNLVGLTKLDLSYSKIKQLPSSIGNLVGLTELDLSCSKIKQLPSSIGNLVGLTKLRLSCSKIKQLPSSIGNLVGLTELHLSFSKIKKLPSSIGNLVGLSKLHLGLTAIEQLPSWIGNLVGLTKLDLSNSKIKQLPSSIGNLVGLTKLNLAYTAIEELPSSIGNLVRLTELDLSGTAIEQLPSWIENLVCLSYLNLGRCKRLCVVGWPLNQHLNRFRCLSKLLLSDCNLGEGAILEDIGCLSSLDWLSLDGNHFVTLPASIQRLSKLNHLGLNNCKMLRELPPLPPPSRSRAFLSVKVRNCTSLQRLTDPSKLSSKLANLYDFYLDPLNCVRLVEDEGFINYVRSTIVRWIIKKDGRPDYGFTFPGERQFTYPASEIPEWFVNKSEEAGDWLGIAFCFVWASVIPDDLTHVTIEWSSGLFYQLPVSGHLEPEHVTMFYMAREDCREECLEPGEPEFSAETHEYYGIPSKSDKVGVNMVKKWAARWVYKQDLVDLQQRLKITK